MKPTSERVENGLPVNAKRQQVHHPVRQKRIMILMALHLAWRFAFYSMHSLTLRTR